MALCTELSGPPQVISAQETILCTESVFVNLSEDVAPEAFKISEFVKLTKSSLKNHELWPLYCNFKLCALDNQALEELNETFFQTDCVKNRVQIISLSYNSFDYKSSSTIMEILKIPSLKYLNLIGTCYSTKYIRYLLEHIKRKKGDDTVLEFSKKLIFIGKDYVSKAKKKVKVYSDMENSKILSKDWDRYHKNYYRDYDGDLDMPSVFWKEKDLSNRFNLLSL